MRDERGVSGGELARLRLTVAVGATCRCWCPVLHLGEARAGDACPAAHGWGCACLGRSAPTDWIGEIISQIQSSV